MIRPPVGEDERPERNPQGLRQFVRSANPRSWDARVDRFKVSIYGQINAGSYQELSLWHSRLERIQDSTRSSSRDNRLLRLRTPPGTLGGFEFRKNRYTLSGSVFVGIGDARSGLARANANVRFNLNLNPTRTLYHLIEGRLVTASEFDNDEPELIRSMPAPDFFTRFYGVTAAAQGNSLDGNDNFLPSIEHLLGSRPETRSRRWAQYLSCYERKLQELISGILSIDSQSDNHGFQADFNRMLYREVEIYWEWRSNSIREKMFNITKGFHAAVRSPNITHYLNSQTLETGRTFAATRVGMDITDSGKKKLVIYLKTPSRIRWEMRYRGYPENASRNISDLREDGMLAVLDEFCTVATNDVQFAWNSIWEILEDTDQEISPVSVLLLFLTKVREVCNLVNGAHFDEICESLLRNGGVSCDVNLDGFSEQTIEALVENQVLMPIRMRYRESRHIISSREEVTTGDVGDADTTEVSSSMIRYRLKGEFYRMWLIMNDSYDRALVGEIVQ